MLPNVGGRSGGALAAVQLITATQQQVGDVASFRAAVRDFSAPRMQLASSLPAAPLKDMRTIDVSA